VLLLHLQGRAVEGHGQQLHKFVLEILRAAQKIRG
jgi:hypothetical protein